MRAHIVAHLIALLAVGIWVAQPLLAIAHAREHVHRYCPTHRAFEEASVKRGTARSSQVQEARAIEKQPPTTVGTLLHEECAFASVSARQELPGPPEVQPVVQACLEVSRPATAPPRPLCALSVLDTAPKASPPARV
ncbi:hypothetical protein [Archangium lipolyticum]|uniref:hypothetical protein n=1 Tax=Archangium lipolyticum TaxID=2970465 RepID=UPI00214A64C1|nr:hypothetical protein [Archangium lipolyticum]